MTYNDILEELCDDKYLWLVYNVSSAPVTPSHSTNPSEVTMVGGSGGRATRGSTSQQAAQSADNPAPPGPAHHGPADPEQDYSRLVLALMDALSEPDVVKKLNRDTINYDRISKEVSKQVQTLVQPLIDSIKQKDAEIAALNDKCDELQERCDDLEQYSRKNSIRISGIPETQDENPFKIVMEVCNKKLNLKSPLQLSEISNCHRVGQRKADGSHRQILVKFMNYQIRKRVFGAKSELKHHNKEFKKNQNVSPRNGDDESNVTSDSNDHNAESADRATDSVDTDADAPILMPGPIYINEDGHVHIVVAFCMHLMGLMMIIALLLRYMNWFQIFLSVWILFHIWSLIHWRLMTRVTFPFLRLTQIYSFIVNLALYIMKIVIIILKTSLMN